MLPLCKHRVTVLPCSAINATTLSKGIAHKMLQASQLEQAPGHFLSYDCVSYLYIMCPVPWTKCATHGSCPPRWSACTVHYRVTKGRGTREHVANCGTTSWITGVLAFGRFLEKNGDLFPSHNYIEKRSKRQKVDLFDSKIILFYISTRLMTRHGMTWHNMTWHDMTWQESKR